MALPGETLYLSERVALKETIRSLTPSEFETGTTLCPGWAPRDVMGHLLGIDDAVVTYVKAAGITKRANAQLVKKYAGMSNSEMLAAIDHWAAVPALHARLIAKFLVGDVAIHHQDILRGLGRSREIPQEIGAAIMREGIVLGGFKKLRHNRFVPSDGGKARGRGPTIMGTKEALGLWLSGRTAVEGELTFT